MCFFIKTKTGKRLSINILSIFQKHPFFIA